MKWFALLGTILFIGVSIVPTIYAIDKEQEFAVYNSRGGKQLKILIGQIKEIISYYEGKYTTFDCGCEDQIIIEWRNPIRCFFLAYAFIFVGTLLILGVNPNLLNLYYTIEDLGKELNCRWA